jgi:aminopeptidase N
MKRIIYFLLLCFFTNGVSAQDRDISYMSSGGKLNPLQANMDIRHYTLALDVDIANESIAGYVTIDFILQQPTDTVLFDLVHFLNVTKITSGRSNKTFFRDHDFIYIVDANGFKPGRQSIKIEYNGKPPVAVNPPWQGGFSWKKDSAGNPWVAINCQLQGAKVYFPCKDHPSDEPNEGVDMFITVPKGLKVAGPGLLKAVTTKKDKQTFHWKTNYTISNYCIVFDIGKYAVVKDTYTTINGNKVPMEFYVLEEHQSEAKEILKLRARDTRILEKYFGEYPWVKEKIGIAEVPNSGMEHQTMITYGGNSGNFKTRKVGDLDFNGNLFHEYAHEWFANKVTNKDWSQMWIQEGIATYADALFSREASGERGYDSAMVMIRKGIKNKIPVVQGDALNSVVAYNGDIYPKGAFMMHTLRYVLGDDLFFPTLKKLATDPKYTYDNFVVTDDVEKLFSAASGKDLKPLFDFCLRTTNKLEIVIKETGFHEYNVRCTNLPMPLDVDVLTNTGTQKITLSNKGVQIISNFTPVVDSNGYYLKTVMSD